MTGPFRSGFCEDGTPGHKNFELMQFSQKEKKGNIHKPTGSVRAVLGCESARKK
jgi:hypothetical protein